MRVLIFVSSIVFVVVAVAALPLSGPAEAVSPSANKNIVTQVGYDDAR